MKRNALTFTKLAVAIACASTFSSSHAATLEEVVVTAQKRTESLQDVPISITAIDGARIDQAVINNLGDLADYVPNLALSETAVSTSITLRGIGPGANQSFEQSVGLYVDGIHLAKGRQARSAFFDLERVEVLRGPQGILFGKNTLAGAVNVTTATPRPGDELSGEVSVALEKYNGHIVEANIAGSVSDNLALRLAVRDRESDGYLKNSLTNTTGPTSDERIVRLAATWTPTESTTVKFKHTEGDFFRGGATPVMTVYSPTSVLAPFSSLAYFITNRFYPQVAQNVANGSRDMYRDGIVLGGQALSHSLGKSASEERKEGTDTQTSETSLNIDIDFGDGYTFTSVTGRAEYEYVDGIDADFLPIRFIGRSDDSEYEQLSQEFRIASDPSKRFSYITGVYVEKQEQDIDRLVTFDGTFGLSAPVATAILGAPSALGRYGQVGRVSNWKQDTDAWAVFFQGEYQIADNLTLTAGIRYTEEDKKARGQTLITSNLTGLATPNYSPILAATMRAVSPNTIAHIFDDERSTDQWTPGVSLEWEQSDNHLFYASYSEGFKSGGFNAADDQAPDLTTTPDARGVYTTPGLGWSYEDETAKSLEIGGKHTLLDGAMTMNWALFTSKYDNQQVSTYVGTSFVVANASSSQVDGLEVDVKWQATDNLLVGANVAYLDATYDKFDTAACNATQLSNIAAGASSSNGCVARVVTGRVVSSQDLSGKTLPGAPDYSGALFFNYDKPINDQVNWFIGADLIISGSFIFTGDLDPLDTQESYEKINFQTGFRTDTWEAMIYGKNITDEETATSGFDTPLLSGSHSAYAAAGAIWGARFSYKF